MSGFASIAVNTLRSSDTELEEFFSSRLSYTFQLIIGRKFSEGFSLQLSPSLVHRNLVATTDVSNDVFAIGIGARQKISKRLSINAEYIYVFPGQIDEIFANSFSLGLDIETGGHVFQLHFTNSRPIIEKGFIAETTDAWFEKNESGFYEIGSIHFGFNIARVFTLWEPGVKAKKNKKKKNKE